MELEAQENMYKNKKKDVDKLSKILEEVIQLSNSNTTMNEKDLKRLIKHYESEIKEKTKD
jgi:hypothetical protein